MKRVLLFFTGMLFLFSCEYQDNGVTSINEEITKDYLLTGTLDTYITNNQIVRLKGKPGAITVPIGNADLTKYEPCFVLHVATGTTQATIVSSAIIKLDDMVVLNTSDFSKNGGQYQFEVCNLTPLSVLTVEVRGEPDSYIDVWIEGKKKELTVTDCDGNVYKTVKIGEQVWMAENLKTTTYNDCGTAIPYVEDRGGYYGEWYNLRSPSYAILNFEEANITKYGLLYNNYTIATDKLCPTGWHVPSTEEFKQLVDYLGGDVVAYPKLIEGGSSGFNLMFGGIRDYPGNFGYNECILWLSTLCFVQISPIYDQVRWFPGNQGDDLRRAFSVRCIKDN